MKASGRTKVKLVAEEKKEICFRGDLFKDKKQTAQRGEQQHFYLYNILRTR